LKERITLQKETSNKNVGKESELELAPAAPYSCTCSGTHKSDYGRSNDVDDHQTSAEEDQLAWSRSHQKVDGLAEHDARIAKPELSRSHKANNNPQDEQTEQMVNGVRIQGLYSRTSCKGDPEGKARNIFQAALTRRFRRSELA
jgi:hypothetical protein